MQHHPSPRINTSLGNTTVTHSVRYTRITSLSPASSGYILLLVLGIVALMGVAGMALLRAHSTEQSGRAQRTATALAQAREALIAYAVQRHFTNSASPTYRPGDLPCPAADNDGGEESSCSPGAIGRVPWKSLGIAPPIDGDGEVIWYALSGNFRRFNTNHNPINSLTNGTLKIIDEKGNTVEGNAVFVLFAAGPTLPGQDRSEATTLCGYSGSDQKNNLCPSNYLDTLNGTNNAKRDGPFITSPSSSTFNDSLLYVSTEVFIHALEQRVLADVANWLRQYQTANAYLPYASPSACTSTTDKETKITTSTCVAEDGLCSGHFPIDAATTSSAGWPPTIYVKDADKTAPYTKWFLDNHWAELIFYTANSNNLAKPTLACPVTLAGNNQSAIIMLPGSARMSVNTAQLNTMYEDPANQDAWTLGAAGRYDFQTPTASSNDRLYVIP